MPTNIPPSPSDQEPRVIIEKDRFEEYWRKIGAEPALEERTAPYSDSVRFIEERHSTLAGEPFPESLADMPPETLRHYLRYFEAFVAAEVRDPLTLPTALLPKFHYHGLFLACSMYKILLEKGEIRDPQGRQQKLTTVENILFQILKTADPMMVFSTLLRIGQDAGREYAAAASKLLHLFRYQVPPGEEVIDVARETVDQNGERSPATYIVPMSSYKTDQYLAEFKKSDRKRERIMAWKHSPPLQTETHEQKISAAPAYMIQSNQGLASLSKHYETHFREIILILIHIFLQKFYNEDGGVITDENMSILGTAHMTAAFLKFLDTPQESWPADIEERVQAERLRISRAFVEQISHGLSQDEMNELCRRLAKDSPGIPEPYREKLTSIRDDILVWLPLLTQLEKCEPGDESFIDTHINVGRRILEDPDVLTRNPLVRGWAIQMYAKFNIRLGSALESGRTNERVLREIHARNAEDILITPAQDMLLRAVSGTPIELIYVLENLFRSLSGKINLPKAHPIIEKIVKCMERYPDGISKALSCMVPEDPGDEKLMNATPGATDGISLRVFPVLLKSQILREQLFAVLTKPDYQTHYNACCVAAYMLKKDGGRGPFASELLGVFFQAPVDYLDPIKMAVIRNVLERLPKGTRSIFLKEFLRLPNMPEGAEEKKRTFFLLGEFGEQALREVDITIRKTRRKLARVEARGRAEERAQAPLELLKSLSVESFHQHDLNSMIQDIIEHRTIALGNDGHRVSLETCFSTLNNTFLEARVKKNSETGNPPKGLACNVTLVSTAGVNVYCKLGIHGELMIRQLDEQQQEKGVIARAQALENGISEELFDELHALILEVLATIYLRKETVEDHSDTEETAEGTGRTPPEVTEVAEVRYEAGLPVTREREVGKMRISLPGDIDDEERRRKRIEHRLIETNRERVRAAFEALASGRDLTETPPFDLSELRLFQAAQTDANAGLSDSPRFVTVFEPTTNPTELYGAIRTGSVKLDDVWIRISRSFAQPLPYVAYERPITYAPGEQPRARSLWIVRQKKPRPDATSKHTAFIVHEHGEELDLSGRKMTLHFEADERQDPSIRRMGERVNGLVFDPSEQKVRELERGKFELLADNFPFEQTFNYGRFITLRELLFGKQTAQQSTHQTPQPAP